MTAARFHELEISSVRAPSSDSIAIAFNVPRELRKDFDFVPGQYLTLRTEIDGEDVRRSYSICSMHGSNRLEVGIRKVDGGVFSTHALTLKPGDRLQVMPPQGRFTAELGGSHKYLLIAAGSGITPCLSIARSVLQYEADSEITLLYANRSRASVMFRGDIGDLKDRFTGRFNVHFIMSREDQDVPLLNGRLDQERITELAKRGLIDPGNCDAAYVCGPLPMIESVTEGLKAAGMAAADIHFELFGTENVPPPHPRDGGVQTDGAGSTVEIRLDGSNRQIQVDGSRQTVLLAAQAAGLDLPFSCAGGMCCTCRCRIVEGEAEMDVNYSLQDWEVEAGFVLACQARPRSEKLVLDFDAA